MMQTLLVGLIVLTAVLFIARRVIRSLGKSKAEAAGCANCDGAAPDAGDWAR